MARYLPLLVIPALLGTFSAVPASADPADPPHSQRAIDVSDRAASNTAYLTRMLTALETPAETTADLDTCTPGTVTAATWTGTETALNYVRALAGLDSIRIDPALSVKAQQAALIMAANNDLNHYPPTSWKCYTADGAWGASHSNLAGMWPTATTGEHILLYMTDPGDNNVRVGHRRWILTPTTTTMGSGYANGYDALTVVGTGTNPAATTPPWITWPTSGYFPAPLEPAGRWSAATTDPDMDMTGASASVRLRSGAVVPVQPLTGAWGQITWAVINPATLLPAGTSTADDVTVDVTITGLRRNGAAIPDYTYSTTVFQPAESITWSRRPQITGAAVVNGTLTADPGTFNASDSATEISYRWLRDGTAIPEATDATYRPGAADAGHTITVQVTVASAHAVYTGTATSDPTSRIALAAPPAVVQRPTVQGTMKVGRRLTATPGGYSVYEGTTTFQWLRNGRPVSKVKPQPSYLLTSGDRRHRISVRVVYTVPGYRPVVTVSKARKVS